MRKSFGLILTLIPLLTFSQKGITFEVEKLTKPNSLLRLTPPEKIYTNLIKFDLNISNWDEDNLNKEIPYNIVAQSHLNDSLVTYIIILSLMECIKPIPVTDHLFYHQIWFGY